MIKSLSNKVEIKDREMEDKFNKINDKIEQNANPSVQFNKNNDMDEKFEKMNTKIEQIITTLNQLSKKRSESKTRKHVESSVNYSETPSKTDSNYHPHSKQDTK